jgi:hypothetical protein
MLYLAITLSSIDIQLFLQIYEVEESMKLVNRKTNTYYKDQTTSLYVIIQSFKDTFKSSQNVFRLKY